MSDNSGGSAASSRPRSRPEFRNIHVSQLLSYRLPPAGIVSILHRISGALLFLVGIPFVLYLFQKSITSELSFEHYREISGHWFARLLLLALSWAMIHHFLAGVRYLLLDLHVGVQKEQSAQSALVVFALSAAATLWAGLKIFGVL